jgi:hypothetical protein
MMGRSDPVSEGPVPNDPIPVSGSGTFPKFTLNLCRIVETGMMVVVMLVGVGDEQVPYLLEPNQARSLSTILADLAVQADAANLKRS